MTNDLWKKIWVNENELSPLYKNEEEQSKEKFNQLVKGVTSNYGKYNLDELIEESSSIHSWKEPEWGFPKGRRNNYENDYDCALREFEEETGIKGKKLRNIQNLIPFEEIFTGSNYKSYKHKYYVMNIGYKDSTDISAFQKSEVSKIEWKNYKQCLEDIRFYNMEKKTLLKKIHNCLSQYKVI